MIWRAHQLDTLRRRWEAKCPKCGDLDGQHLERCRFRPPFGTFADMLAHYQAQARAVQVFKFRPMI